MSAKQDIITNLVDNGDNSFNSFLSGNVSGIDRRCELVFPASSWDTARAAGNTFMDVLNNTQDKTFDCLYYMTITLDIYDPVEHLIYINTVEFSGLWRPADPAPPHVDGRAMDIVRITFSLTGDAILFNNVDNTHPEPGALPALRDALYPGHVTQYLSPWWIASKNPDGSETDRSNDRTSPLDKDHLNHLHLTIPR